MYGPGWRRENSFVSHNPTGVFCYGFYPFDPTKGGYKHPAGWTAKRGPGTGEKYRLTASGPGVTPNVAAIVDGLASVRHGEPGRRRLPAAAVERAALVGRPALPRRLVLAAASRRSFSSASAGAADSPVATVTQTLSGLDDIASGGFEPPDVRSPPAAASSSSS